MWLGIKIDLGANTISIPEDKLQEIKTTIGKAANRASLRIKEVQSLIGSINHLSKAVHPARLFMGRILEALRQSDGHDIPVDEHVKADLRCSAILGWSSTHVLFGSLGTITFCAYMNI